MNHEHFHRDESGLLVKCYHHCKHWFSPGFLAGYLVVNTILFPLEHTQWDHIWPFDYVGGWLDRTGHLQMWISYVWVIAFLICCIVGIIYSVRNSKTLHHKPEHDVIVDETNSVPTVQYIYLDRTPIQATSMGNPGVSACAHQEKR